MNVITKEVTDKCTPSMYLCAAPILTGRMTFDNVKTYSEQNKCGGLASLLNGKFHRPATRGTTIKLVNHMVEQLHDDLSEGKIRCTLIQINCD
jgi:hypothetical protein